MIKKSCKNRSVESKIDVENSNAQNNRQETQPLGPTMTVVDLHSPLDLVDADRDVNETVQWSKQLPVNKATVDTRQTFGITDSSLFFCT